MISGETDGDPVASLRMASDACEEALLFYSPERWPEEYAEVQMIRRSIFAAMAGYGQPHDAGMLWEKAADACRNALRIYTRELPEEHALAEKHLGDSLVATSELCDVDEKRAELLDEAVRAYSAALLIYGPEDTPIEYAGTLKSLGYAQASLADLSDYEENLKRAIKAYKKALKIYSRGAHGRTQAVDGSQDLQTLADGCLAAIRRCRIALKARKNIN